MLYLAPLALLSLSMPGLGVRQPVAQPLRASMPPKMEEPHCTCIFLRHGQSTWNEASLFTGWADVELTTLGKNEAAAGATQLWSEGYQIDVAYTSLLKRAQQTLDIVLTITGQEDVPVHSDWRLNERMYGGLTGLNKKETAEKFGADQVKVWRRSYDTPPPPIDTDSKYWPGNDNAYAHIPMADIPLSECLKDTVERTIPFWDGTITPALRRGKTVLVAAHGNSIRGMLKHVDGISDEEIVDIEIPTGVPLVYKLDKDLKPIKQPQAVAPLSGAFLGDASEIEKARQQVAEQSKTRAGEMEAKDQVQFLCIGSGCLMLSNEEMEQAFARADIDENGLIDSNEVYTIIDQLADDDDDELTMEKVEEMIRMVDRDGDGKISFEEFVQAVTAEKETA